jgi:hypothetical protein
MQIVIIIAVAMAVLWILLPALLWLATAAWAVIPFLLVIFLVAGIIYALGGGR